MHDIGPTQLESDGPHEYSEFGEFGEFAGSSEASGELTEAQEIGLATELLEATSEQELEQFLGSLFDAVGQATGRFVRSDTGQALGGILRDAAKQALPVVGRAVGSRISPSAGDAGAQLATAAGNIFGLETEGLSSEDREWEMARQFVKFAGAAARNAALTPRGADPLSAARRAAATAARLHAPGLLPRLQGRSGQLWPRAGRWVRRGRTIELYGE
jgi:hypothetical protein